MPRQEMRRAPAAGDQAPAAALPQFLAICWSHQILGMKSEDKLGFLPSFFPFMLL